MKDYLKMPARLFLEPWTSPVGRLGKFVLVQGSKMLEITLSSQALSGDAPIYSQAILGALDEKRFSEPWTSLRRPPYADKADKGRQGQKSSGSSNHEGPDEGHGGFTLIELLIVMIIIGLLAALVGPKMFGKVEKSRVQAAHAQISLFETALDTYRLDNRHYPASGEGLDALIKNPGGEESWDGPYVKKIPRDPWGHDYVYSCDGSDDYSIRSCGPDGAANTEDDISNQEEGSSAEGERGTVVPPGNE